MAAISKFFQVTNQLLLEYKSDKYKSTVKYAESGDTDCNFIMYQGDNGLQYCIDMENIKYWKFPDSGSNTYYYPGRFVEQSDLDISDTDEEVYGNEISFYNESHGVIIKDSVGNSLRNTYLNKDKIRIYILSGYVFNSLAGIAIRVKAKVNYVYNSSKTVRKHIDDYLTFLDYIMPKELIKDNVKWLDAPLYLNSKFYDRYIEVSFPSPIDAGYNARTIDYVYVDEKTSEVYRGSVDPSATVYVEFSSISPDFMDLVQIDSMTYESTFTLDTPKVVGINAVSNSNFFNVRLLEDPNTNAILYYPVYGDEPEAQDLNLDLMYAIESGNIPMIDVANYDSANDGMDDFIEMYGSDVNRWIIINEIAVTYNYRFIIEPDSAMEIPPITEYITNTIDYTGKQDIHGQFWRSRFVPAPKHRNGMEPTTITIKYTAHLYNRMNGMDIIRTASITVDARKYNQETSIQIANLTKYKVINKIEKAVIKPTATTSTTTEKYIRTYYDATDIVVNDVNTGRMYTQGQMILRLKHTSSNYMFKLYAMNDDNVRIPYNLAGNSRYKLVFPTVTGDTIKIFPNADSENNNLGIGSLVYYISGDIAKQIMNVPDSERYFAIVVDAEGTQAQESTLYEGKVAYYS